MKIQYFLTADHAIQDSSNNKYTLIGIFDNFNIQPEAKEVVVGSFVIFFKISGTKATENVKIQIDKPNGETYTELVLSPDKPTETDNLTVAAFLANLTFTEIGDYPVTITLNDEAIQPAPNQYLTVEKLDE